MRHVLMLFAMMCLSKAQMDPRYATNVVVYHVNQITYADSDIRNMNTADQAGDLYFDARSKVLPLECAANPNSHDCYNPEVNSTVPLTITKLNVTMDSRYVNYSRCNLVNGSYSCGCAAIVNGSCFPAVGRTTVRQHFIADRHPPPSSAPNWEWWRYNLANYTGGIWYSTLSDGMCQTNTSGPCYWHVNNVIKRIYKTCSDDTITRVVVSENERCFDACPQPTNTSSTCWIDCFYGTVLGKDAAAGAFNPDQALDLQTFVSAFEAPFLSNDPKRYGCPSV